MLFDMQTVTKETEAEDFYRERYGIDISGLDQIIRSSLENLYFRDIRLSPSKLYSKLEQCGVKLSPGTVSRVRKEALFRNYFTGKCTPAAPPVPERRRLCDNLCQKSPRPNSRRLPATTAPLSA